MRGRKPSPETLAARIAEKERQERREAEEKEIGAALASPLEVGRDLARWLGVSTAGAIVEGMRERSERWAR